VGAELKMLPTTNSLRAEALDVLPVGLTQKIRAYRRSELFRRTGIAMVHVPRTAGYSLSQSVYDRFIGHFTLQDLLLVAPREVVSLPRFTVIRNPWSRLASAWSYARVGGGRGQKHANITHPEQYQISAFTTFDRFVHEWLDQRILSNLDVVFHLQSDYLLDKSGSIAFDHIGTFEDLDATSSWLSETLSRRIVLGRLNRSSAVDYRSLYTSETRDRVARIYAADIALLGYDF
jgi:hypothetical protein